MTSRTKSFWKPWKKKLKLFLSLFPWFENKCCKQATGSNVFSWICSSTPYCWLCLFCHTKNFLGFSLGFADHCRSKIKDIRSSLLPHQNLTLNARVQSSLSQETGEFCPRWCKNILSCLMKRFYHCELLSAECFFPPLLSLKWQWRWKKSNLAVDKLKNIETDNHPLSHSHQGSF